MLKTFLSGLFLKASHHNRKNILSSAATVSAPSLLDLGCDDGDWTLQVAKAAKAERTSGVEIIQERARLARDRGIQVELADLNDKLPFPNSSFGLVHANQVIEHVLTLTATKPSASKAT